VCARILHMSRFSALDSLDSAEEGNASPSPKPKVASDVLPLADPIFWIDLEMTGLDPNQHTILEVACIVTDGSLRRQIDGPCIVIHHDDDTLAAMNDWSCQQHGQSGLTERCRASSASMADAEAALVDFVLAHRDERQRVVLGGACVYKDKEFIERHMPLLSDYLSHRVIDVSTVRLLAWRWLPAVARAMPRGADVSHRALDDIRYSISELAYYRDHAWQSPRNSTNNRRRSGGGDGPRRRGGASDRPQAHSDQPQVHNDRPQDHSDQPQTGSDRPQDHSDQPQTDTTSSLGLDCDLSSSAAAA